MSEVIEARFDGELELWGLPLTVRVWVSCKGSADLEQLLTMRTKFEELMEIGHAQGELVDVARLISTALNGATVELVSHSARLGTVGIVYYPEWP